MKKLFGLFLIIYSFIFSQEIGARYLIITNDAFYDAILPYAQWKHKMGLRTKIVRVPSELAQNSTSIRNYIVNAYNTWQIKPDFILFVGAPNYIPWSISTYPYGDNNYTNMDGDIYNEILSGRLNVHNLTEAQTVVAKMLRYERYPDISDSTWFKKGCLIVRDIQDDDSVTYRLDAQYVAGYMVNNGYVKVDTFFASRGANATSVINATNEGRGFVVYRGTATNNWYSPFAVNPDNLANGNKLPIVISATCGTLSTGSTATTAERWFLTGSPTNLRGAAGYFSTTTTVTNGAHLRSAVTRGFFDGVFLYKRRTFGEACEDGRLRVYNTYGSTTEYQGFTTIGDPAMRLWTATPRLITAIYDSILYVGLQETLQVDVLHQGNPVESAYVCIMLDTLIYQTGWTDGSGTVSFIFTPPSPGTLDITVTGRNLYPFEGTASIITDTCFIVYQGRVVNDSLGNNNGGLDPGETILLNVLLKNVSNVVGEDIRAVLRTTDTMIAISDTISFFGNINPNVTKTGLNPFIFSVSPLTYGHLAPFELSVRDINNNTWQINFFLQTTGSGGGGGGTGPDPYGYYIYDNTDTATTHAPTYSWFEIAPPAGGPGQIIPEITNDDADTVTLPLPFTFKFYGINYTTIGICSNGFVEFGGATYPYSYNDPIPRVGRAKRYTSPFWDDLNPGLQQMGHGDIYRYYDPVNHLWYVEFYQVALGYGGGGQWETFQIILRDPAYYPTPTGDGEILFMYNSIVNPNGCTVGIEDETETRGVSYLFNGNYDANAAPIQNGRALLITTKPPRSQHSPWINLVSYSINDSTGGNNNGIPEPNETIELTIQIQNNGDTLVSDVMGIMNTNSSNLYVIDSIASFGSIDVGQIVDNTSNPYLLQIGACPQDTLAGIAIHLTGNNGNYNTTAYLTLRIHYPTGVGEMNSERDDRLMLRVYPNPFPKYLKIKFQIPNLTSPGFNNSRSLDPKSEISLSVYDVSGRLLRRWADGTIRNKDQIIWDGCDESGRSVPAGVYFIKFETDENIEFEKAVLIK